MSFFCLFFLKLGTKMLWMPLDAWDPHVGGFLQSKCPPLALTTPKNYGFPTNTQH